MSEGMSQEEIHRWRCLKGIHKLQVEVSQLAAEEIEMLRERVERLEGAVERLRGEVDEAIEVLERNAVRGLIR